jgi:hypothetical protein
MMTAPRVIQVVCRRNGATTGLFTDGKVYEARRYGASERLYTVYDDRGHPRHFIPNEPCPHLVVATGNRYGMPSQKVVGMFETLTGESNAATSRD